MEILKKLLFGKKISIQDEQIGVLSCRVKSINPSKEYTWVSEHLLAKQAQKTIFILEGNCTGPYPSQLKAVYRIIDELSLIIEKVDGELRKNHSKYKKLNHWTNNFYLAALTPNDVSKNEFEICFDPFSEENTQYISLIWENGNIREIKVN